jgi:hypothetical protein
MSVTTAARSVVRTIGDLNRRSKLRLAWDAFMVWVALINLWMILFDLSYLWLRPVYHRYLPVVTAIYDPVKGIEAHPLTGALLAEIEATGAALQQTSAPRPLPEHVDRLRDLTVQVVRENPFERSGMGRATEMIRDTLGQTIGRSGGALSDPEVLREAAASFWPDDPVRLEARIKGLDPALLRTLDLNYHRSYDRDGRLTDWFWLLDLPFLLLFWVEFTVRWIHALRLRTYARWYFFPIFNWYDVLGLIPVAVFRPFRLLRAVSMYMRLRRSALSSVGKDIFTRTVLYFSNIITEEVSDRVAIRILSEFHEEISDGTHARIIRSVVEPRKAEIEAVLADQIRQTLTAPETLDRLRSLVMLNLDTAVSESEALRAIPLPKVVLRPAVRAVGEVILDTTIETVTATLGSAEGEAAVREAAGAILDDVFYGPGLKQVEGLVKEITLAVLEHMMDVVQVKKWAMPEDQDKRPPMPWEPEARELADPTRNPGTGSDERSKTS